MGRVMFPTDDLERASPTVALALPRGLSRVGLTLKHKPGAPGIILVMTLGGTPG